MRSWICEKSVDENMSMLGDPDAAIMLVGVVARVKMSDEEAWGC